MEGSNMKGELPLSHCINCGKIQILPPAQIA
jgi:hypothetical protein